MVPQDIFTKIIAPPPIDYLKLCAEQSFQILQSYENVIFAILAANILVMIFEKQLNTILDNSTMFKGKSITETLMVFNILLSAFLYISLYFH